MSYIGNEPIVSSTRTVTEIVATTGQTLFTPNGGYTVGFVDVFINGAQLQASDFTATNGTTITLNTACTLNDDVRIVAWGKFNIANIDATAITTGIVAAARLGTGSALSTTYLRGDNTWGAVGGGFTAGTLMLFQQTAAPTGWTKQVTHNDKALRVVSGTAGSGGSTGFTAVFTNQIPTISATTLATTQIPSHNHTVAAMGGGSAMPYFYTCGSQAAGASTLTTSSSGGGGSHTHTAGAVTLNVQYVDIIIASKD
jgi:hypothetical protein